MSIVLSAVAKIAPILAQLTPDERDRVFELLTEAGESEEDRRRRVERDRKRRQRDRSGTLAGQKRDISGTETGHQWDRSGTGTGPGRDIDGTSRASESLSDLNLSDSEQIRRGEGSGSTVTADPPAGTPPPCSSEPPRRRNPTVLIEAFVDGVNSKGGTYTPPMGRPYLALAEALDAHVRKAPTVAAAETCRDLGRRWLAYTKGAPQGPFKVIEWLGMGAPASEPLNEAQELREVALRAEAAKARERDRERQKREEARAPPPPEALQFAFGRTAPSGTVRSTAEQLEALEQLDEEAKRTA